jgi:uncharacterized membrane protein (Fun14 family)
MDFGALLSQYGLPGIIIFALGWALREKDKNEKLLYTKLFEVQEQRRLEGLETAKELNATLQSFSQSTTMLIDKIKVVRGEK